ncbi:MAG: energy-coupling factor transporter transmembrane protein EcfT, partial [Anaerolineales bacterium]|nr:energy-coupling factor transporter transmembrane protein EcfT [Anaerolineales bacterium]
MGEFGLLSFFTAGQVLPDGSWLHRLDPRTRLLGGGGLLLALVLIRRFEVGLIGLAVVLFLTVLAHVPLRFAFRGLWLLLPWILVLIAIQLVFRLGNTPGCIPMLTWGRLVVTDCTVNHALLSLARFAGMILLVSLFAWTTPIPDLAHGLEALAGPLDRVGLPAHELA